MVQFSFKTENSIYLLHQENTATHAAEKELRTRKSILFKEISDKDELIEMFALRSLVYHYINFFSGLKKNQSKEVLLDIDPYDLYSTFLSAFEITDHSKKLIGTVRIISGDERSTFAPYIKSLYESLPGNESNGKIIRVERFPHLETFGKLAKQYSSLFGKDNSTGVENTIFDNRPFEISRLAVLPSYWKTNDRLEHGLHLMIILNSWKAQPKRNNFVIATHPRTKRLYERIGFNTVPETGERLYKRINQPAILMQLNLNEYLKKPNPYSILCSFLYSNYFEKGYILQENIWSKSAHRKNN